MRFTRFLAMLTLGLMLAAPVPAQTATPVANPRDVVDIMVAAVAARDANAFAALYDEDALLLGSSQQVVSGRAAIRDTWAHNFAGGYSMLEVGTPRTERGADRALMVYVWRATIQRTGQADQQVTGRSMVYFRLVEGGWLISADMWQPRP